MTKTIGLDIDNTITAPETLTNLLNSHFGLSVKPEDMEYYCVEKCFNISKEDISKFWGEHTVDYIKNSTVSPALPTIYDNYINNQEDFKLVIITARSPEHTQITLDWLAKYNIYYDSIEFTNGKSKLELLKELGVTTMIDDKGELFTEVWEEGLDKTIECILVDQTYNKAHPSHIRIDSNTGKQI